MSTGPSAPRGPAAPLDITVVIPAYRAAAFVATAVRSALAQVPPPREVLVVDDCSPDDGGDVARAEGARVIRNPENLGLGLTRNVGIENALGSWVALLDADDEFLPGHLQRLWNLRAGHDLVADVARGTQDGRWYGTSGRQPRVLRRPSDVFFPQSVIAPSAAMLRRDAALAVGGFTDVRKVEDLQMWIKMLEVGTACVIPKVGVRYHQHDAQMSSDSQGMRDMNRVVLLGFKDAPWFRSWHLASLDAKSAWDTDRRSALAQIRFWPFIVVLVLHRRQVRRRLWTL